MAKQLTIKEYDSIKAGLAEGRGRAELAAEHGRSNETVIRIAKSRGFDEYKRQQKLSTGRYMELDNGDVVLKTHAPRQDAVYFATIDADIETDGDEKQVVSLLRMEQERFNSHIEATIALIQGLHR